MWLDRSFDPACFRSGSALVDVCAAVRAPPGGAHCPRATQRERRGKRPPRRAGLLCRTVCPCCAERGLRRRLAADGSARSRDGLGSTAPHLPGGDGWKATLHVPRCRSAPPGLERQISWGRALALLGINAFFKKKKHFHSLVNSYSKLSG